MAPSGVDQRGPVESACPQDPRHLRWAAGLHRHREHGMAGPECLDVPLLEPCRLDTTPPRSKSRPLGQGVPRANRRGSWPGRRPSVRRTRGRSRAVRRVPATTGWRTRSARRRRSRLPSAANACARRYRMCRTGIPGLPRKAEHDGCADIVHREVDLDGLRPRAFRVIVADEWHRIDDRLQPSLSRVAYATGRLIALKVHSIPCNALLPRGFPWTDLRFNSCLNITG